MEKLGKTDLYRRIVRAKLFIDDSFSSDLDLDRISEQAYFSKYHFIRLFKLIYGKTPKHYLTKVRMDKAKVYLNQGHSVLEASVSVGFESPTTFTGTFKRQFGITPSEYRRKQELKRNAIMANPLQFVPNCFSETHGWTKEQY